MRDGFTDKNLSIQKICDRFGMSPQGYYKSLRKELKAEYSEAVVVKLIQQCRSQLPVEGYHKLYKRLRVKLIEHGIKIGRDKLLGILRRNDLLVKHRRKYVNTTQSRHRFYVYENLIESYEVRRPNEVYVSDITYIKVGKGFMYLSLITDLYSRKIVGFNLSDSLGIKGSIKALRMALNQREDESQSLIHHSDRGIQYCSKEYVGILKKNGAKISMAGKGNCYENAVAERVNGILKQEFGLDQRMITSKQANKVVKESIRKYNEVRLHMSLQYQTPAEKHIA